MFSIAFDTFIIRICIYFLNLKLQNYTAVYTTENPIYAQFVRISGSRTNSKDTSSESNI